MKIVCFPHYTAGGLVCDIINNTFSPIGKNGGINSFAHSHGKIGDSDSIYTDFDVTEFNTCMSKYQNSDITVGTHCWPGDADLSIAREVILITTETSRSKIYRWLRAWHLYFSTQSHIKQLTGIELVDKQRELAKNYLAPFRAVPAATNLEFADLVEATQEFRHVVKGLPIEHHLDRWRKINYFLYDTNMWDNDLVHRFYEAEFEAAHARYYKYY